MLTVVLFLGSAVTIYFACEFFVNGVEWLGRKLGVGETATGTVLAAFGTALPESAVTFVAVVLGRDAAQKDIGVGAALGGPLVLATISYAVVGAAMFWNHRRLGRLNREVECDSRKLRKDQAWFLAIFIFKITLGLVVFSYKPWLGTMFLIAYGVYLLQELRGEQVHGDEILEPLRFHPKGDPGVAWPLLQTGLALIAIAIASKVFVGQLEAIGVWAGLSPQLVALLLSPVATELPETMNALIWVRQGKERLALANISGAMMIQATIPTALGLFYTSWVFSRELVVSGAVTMMAVAILLCLFSRKTVDARWLIPLSALYAVFVLIIVVW
ncbi:MAG: sodium:calcium antiporter [Pseudomonadota bacterium]|nr:sodium:calcium antiporter [Pseudomonadota bacterium]